jgi:hypothetical protein
LRAKDLIETERGAEEDPDLVSWPYEVGVLLSQNEAAALVFAAEQYFRSKKFGVVV